VYGGRPKTQAGETAGTLILIGLILQGIGVAVLLLVGLIFLIVPVFGLFVYGFAVIGILWLILIYIFSYRRTKDGDYARAQTPTLVFGILSLLSLGVVSGILYIVAYAKLGDAEREAQPVPAVWGGPPPLSAGTRFCPHCGRPNVPGGGFCPGCGARLG